jgi:hypothetical protein
MEKHIVLKIVFIVCIIAISLLLSINLSIKTSIRLILIEYFALTIFGIFLFNGIINKEKFSTFLFTISQFSILIGIGVLIFVSAHLNLITPDTLKNLDILKTQNYFNLGSLSLAIAGIVFSLIKDDNKKHEPRRVALLTLCSAFLFFFFGTLSGLFGIFSISNDIFNYIKASAFFLGSYDLLFSALILLIYFLQRWGKKL